MLFLNNLINSLSHKQKGLKFYFLNNNGNKELQLTIIPVFPKKNKPQHT